MKILTQGRRDKRRDTEGLDFLCDSVFSLRLCVKILLLLLTIVPFNASAQKKSQGDQDQPIKMTTTLVEVRAVVTDKQDKPIRDLKQEDFEIIENKQLQEVSFFSQITVGTRGPISSSPSPTVPAPGTGVSPAPSVPGTAARPSRSIVLFVDNLHLSDSSLLLSKQTLKRFIAEKLTDDDLVAVMTSGGTLGLFSQFSRDRRVLQAAVDKIGSRGANRQSLFTPYLAAQVEAGDRDAMSFAIQILQQEDSITGPRSVLEGIASARSRQIVSEATYQRRVTLSTLKALTERVATLPGQRLIVTLSDGFTLYAEGGTLDTGDIQTVTSKAAVAGVVIYTIDAKGLQPPPMFDVSLRGPVGSLAANSFLSAGESDLKQSMNSLARDTGGEPFFNTNDLGGAMRKVLDNNDTYYALGYYPSSDQETNKFRRITVRIKSHPEYKVRAQQGYLPSALAKERKDAEAKTPQQKLAEAAVAPLALADIGVFTTADYIETEVDAAQVSLQVFIDGSKLEYRPDKDRHHFTLEMISLVFDASGRQVKADTTTIQTALLPETLERAKQLGFRYSRRIELKPGTYQVRVGVREVETDRLGTAAAWVSVPTLDSKKLQVSSILLTDPATLDHIVTLGKENLTLQVGTRQGLKAYRQSDIIGFYLRVYPPANWSAADLAGLTYHTEVLQGERVVAETGWKALPSVEAISKGVELGRQFPLAGIPAGFYELKVLIKSAKSKAVTERTASFEIVR